MNPFAIERLLTFWSAPEVGANLVILMNLVGALILGAFVGYERTYRSRAAGMRTYGLVCAGSAGLTVIGGYAEFWYGGHFLAPQLVDPSRVIQGIVTGIGFIGAGVIMKDGFRISGLTTAASIWVVAAIGVLVGLGLYAAGITLAAISTAFMMWGARIEVLFPAEVALAVTMKFAPSAEATESDIRKFLGEYGYFLAKSTITITVQNQMAEWRFVAIGKNRDRCASLSTLARKMESMAGVKELNLAHARN